MLTPLTGADRGSLGQTLPFRTRLLRTRADAVRLGRRLNQLTISWNLMEGAVAVVAGWLAGSVSLVGFGLDSAIEVSAAGVLTWRLAREGRGGCMQAFDRLATRAIAVSFGLLALYVTGEGVFDLATGTKPQTSPLGVALASASLVVMPLLARVKRQLAPVLGSRAVLAEAKQTSLCGWLSGALLLGLGAHWALGWWWADPAAAVAIGGLAAREAWGTWHAESLTDTCCA
jgi:divalent metal cation (Fe/Co/Zn/Cd) transporter